MDADQAGRTSGKTTMEDASADASIIDAAEDRSGGPIATAPPEPTTDDAPAPPPTVEAIGDASRAPAATAPAAPTATPTQPDRPPGATADQPDAAVTADGPMSPLATQLPRDALTVPVGIARPLTGELVPHKELVPWRTIWAGIGIVLAAVAVIELVFALQQVIELLVISSFLAVVLSPAVSVLVRLKMRRGLATSVVFLCGMAAFAGLGYLLIHPLYQQAVHFADDLPNLLAKTQAGKGRLGELIARYHLQSTAATVVPKIRHFFSHLGGPALTVARQVLSGLGGLVTVFIMTFLLLLQGPAVVQSSLRLLPERHAQRVRRVLQDVAKSVTGYVIGNVATSIIAGVIVAVALSVLNVPFAFVFGVWVAMVDLLPLIGGLLAGVPTVAFAALHSPTAGVITLIVFLVYQQVENHILNPLIMSRTVRLNPLWVILSVLAGAQLAGFFGALLAIPAAGAIHVIARDIWDERRGRLKAAPTTGEDHKPVP
jgi:predicted PurR-regulated permease PerM